MPDTSQTEDQRTPTEQNYGSFFTKVNQDEIEAKNLKERLFATTAQIYDPHSSTEEIKFAVIGCLEEARQFLFSYKDALNKDLDVLGKLKEAIDNIRLRDLDREAINEIFQDIREPLSFEIAAQLGFRKKRIAKYSWVEKQVDRMQLQDKKTLREVIQDALGKKKISSASSKTS